MILETNGHLNFSFYEENSEDGIIISKLKKKKKSKMQFSQEIEDLEKKNQEFKDLDPLESDRFLFCQTELNKIYDDKKFYWQQRTKITWFLEGDNNTKFFHTSAFIRKNKIFIFSLEINGVIKYNPKILQKHINNFYRDLLGILAFN